MPPQAARRRSQPNLPDFFEADAAQRLPDFYSTTHLPDYFSTRRGPATSMPKTKMRHCDNCHAYAVFEPAPPPRHPAAVLLRVHVDPRRCRRAAAEAARPVAELRKKRLWSDRLSRRVRRAARREPAAAEQVARRDRPLGATRTRLRRGVTACDLHSVRGYRDRERAEQSDEAARLVDAFARHGLRVDRDAIARGFHAGRPRPRGGGRPGRLDGHTGEQSLAPERPAAVDALGLDGDATTGGGTPLWIQARTLSSEKYAAVVAEAPARSRHVARFGASGGATALEPTHAVLDAEGGADEQSRRRRRRPPRWRRRRMRRRRRRRPSASRPQVAEVGSPRRRRPRGSGRGRRRPPRRASSSRRATR